MSTLLLRVSLEPVGPYDQTWLRRYMVEQLTRVLLAKAYVSKVEVVAERAEA